ncbi:MAG: hypothetical protein AAGC53_20730 [Actinomycetota bacterium]
MRLTDSLDDLAGWFDGRLAPVELRVFGQHRFGKRGSARFRCDVTLGDDSVRLVLLALADPEWPCSDLTIEITKPQAALWPDALVVEGEIVAEVDAGTGWSPLALEKLEEGTPVWLPALELVVPGRGFRWAVPEAAASLRSWVPPSSRQLAIGRGLEHALNPATWDASEVWLQGPLDAFIAEARVHGARVMRELFQPTADLGPLDYLQLAWLNVFNDVTHAQSLMNSALAELSPRANSLEAHAFGLIEHAFRREVALGRWLGLIPGCGL